MKTLQSYITEETYSEYCHTKEYSEIQDFVNKMFCEYSQTQDLKEETKQEFEKLAKRFKGSENATRALDAAYYVYQMYTSRQLQKKAKSIAD